MGGPVDSRTFGANRSWLPVVVLVIVSVSTVAPASAKTLLLTGGTGYDSSINALDQQFLFGGDSTTALSLTFGSISGSVPYVVDYGNGVTTSFDALAGGSVNYGHMSGNVTAIVDGNGDGISGAVVNAGFDEDVTISNPALTGQSGVMTAAILVDATPTLLGSVVSNTPGILQSQIELTWVMSSTGNLGAGNLVNGSYKLDDESAIATSICGLPAPGGGATCLDPAPFSVLIPVTFAFEFGQPFALGLSLTVTAQAAGLGREYGSFHSEGTLNFLNTVAWQGINNVSLLGDTAPVAFTITSESGADYTQAIAAVPAPASVWLLLTGLVAVGRRAVLGRSPA